MTNLPNCLLKEQQNGIYDAFNAIFDRKFDKLIEIEARLGNIIDRQTGFRINLGVKHPIVFSTPNIEFMFTSGVSDSAFLQTFINFLVIISCIIQRKLLLLRVNIEIFFLMVKKLL